MEEILKINNVDDYNKLFGLETRHPLVSVVDLSQSTQWPTQAIFNYGIYALFLKDIKCGDIRYGRQFYDYQDGTIVSFGPGQITGIDMAPGVRPMAHGLLFHPDLIRGTALGQEIRNYTFFSYEVNEALHLSEEERQTIMDCLNKIQAELEHYWTTASVSMTDNSLPATSKITTSSSGSNVCWMSISMARCRNKKAYPRSNTSQTRSFFPRIILAT